MDAVLDLNQHVLQMFVFIVMKDLLQFFCVPQFGILVCYSNVLVWTVMVDSFHFSVLVVLRSIRRLQFFYNSFRVLCYKEVILIEHADIIGKHLS